MDSWKQHLDNCIPEGLGLYGSRSITTIDKQKEFLIVLYADILGYRSMLTNLGVAELHRILTDSVERIQNFVKMENSRRQKERESGFAKIFDLDAPELDGEIEFFFAFDTIIIYWKDLRFDSLNCGIGAFCSFCGMLYADLLTQHKIKLRGTIAVSQDYAFSEQVITLGNIDLLYRIEKNLNFAGITITIPFLQSLSAWGGRGWIDDEIVFYEVPFKDKSRVMPTLNLAYNKTVKYLRSRELSLGMAGKSLLDEADEVGEPEISEKLKNTANYLRWIISMHDTMRYPAFSWYSEPDERNIPYFDDLSLKWLSDVE